MAESTRMSRGARSGQCTANGPLPPPKCAAYIDRPSHSPARHHAAARRGQGAVHVDVRALLEVVVRLAAAPDTGDVDVAQAQHLLAAQVGDKGLVGLRARQRRRRPPFRRELGHVGEAAVHVDGERPLGHGPGTVGRWADGPDPVEARAAERQDDGGQLAEDKIHPLVLFVHDALVTTLAVSLSPSLLVPPLQAHKQALALDVVHQDIRVELPARRVGVPAVDVRHRRNALRLKVLHPAHLVLQPLGHERSRRIRSSRDAQCDLCRYAAVIDAELQARR